MLHVNLQYLPAINAKERSTAYTFNRMIPEDESPSRFNQEEQRIVTKSEPGKDQLNETRKAVRSLSANSSSKRPASRSRLLIRHRRYQSERDVKRRLNDNILPLNTRRCSEDDQSASALLSPDNSMNIAA